jgi:hypothetical protein
MLFFVWHSIYEWHPKIELQWIFNGEKKRREKKNQWYKHEINNIVVVFLCVIKKYEIQIMYYM